ncbi:MAG TPA: CHAT domain-containing protein [Gemmataceae bacterium]|jgi:hypothetical protein
MIGQVFSIGFDRQRLLILQKLLVKQERFLSLVNQHLSRSPEAIRATLDLILRRKALGAEALATQRDAILRGRYPHLREQFDQLTQFRQRTAQKMLAGPAPGESLAAHERILNEWRQEKEQLETALARQIPEMNLEQRRKADRHAVALQLPDGVALVEFVRFHVFDFHAVPGRGEQRWQLARYLAFVPPTGQPEQVQMIDLGEAGPIDQMVAAFRAGVTGEAELRDMVVAARQPAAGADTSAGEQLRAAVFDPLLDAFGGCRRLLLAPDGDLSRLPFEALPLAGGDRLLDEYRLSYLSAGRDVLRPSDRAGRRPGEPVVAADPDFDLAVSADATRAGRQDPAQPAARQGFWSRLFGRRRHAPASVPALVPATVPAPAAPSPRRLSRDLGPGGIHFPRLLGTLAEGEHVARRLGVGPLLRGAALEGPLKDHRSPRILHLATHGFFLPDQQADLPDFLGRNLELGGAADPAGLGRLSGTGLRRLSGVCA